MGEGGMPAGKQTWTRKAHPGRWLGVCWRRNEREKETFWAQITALWGGLGRVARWSRDWGEPWALAGHGNGRPAWNQVRKGFINSTLSLVLEPRARNLRRAVSKEVTWSGLRFRWIIGSRRGEGLELAEGQVTRTVRGYFVNQPQDNEEPSQDRDARARGGGQLLRDVLESEKGSASFRRLRKSKTQNGLLSCFDCNRAEGLLNAITRDRNVWEVCS